jgi:hypothetical protein
LVSAGPPTWETVALELLELEQADSPRAAATTPAVTAKREIRRPLRDELLITLWTEWRPKSER